jgi:orotidine-5'-phosphate decarboxylase
VGLDSEHGKIPDSVKDRYYSIGNAIVAFNLAIVQATKDLVCAYKPNTAFYEAHGAEGIEALQKTIADIHAIAPDVPVILDAKRADIGNTNMGYVKFAFDYLQADAITVHPYLGGEALKPFLDQTDKGVFVLCRTSNPGAGELQDYGQVYDSMPLYEYVAGRVAMDWNRAGNCGLVVGATYPGELEGVRKIVGLPILIPGVGAQGGDVEKTVKAGKDSRGQGMIINSSRGIIFASHGPNFAEAARHETATLRGVINLYL